MKSKKEEVQKEGISKNENAFNKMKEMLAGGEKVFDYQPQKMEEELEVELEEEDEIKSDLEDDEDQELEYSAEHLEDFMNTLNKNQANQSVGNTGQSEQLITNFLSS